MAVLIRTGRLLPAAVAALVLLVGIRAGSVGQDGPGEFHVKAAFLYNFAKFVEWPSDAFADHRDRMTIGVLGEDPFGADLEAVVNGKEVHGRSLAIKRFLALDELETCHILFISFSEAWRLPEVLAALEGSSTLTVSDIDRFAQRGGMINLVTEQSRVRFEVNLDAAEHEGLKLSSKLLRVARRVGSDGPEETRS